MKVVLLVISFLNGGGTAMSVYSFPDKETCEQIAATYKNRDVHPERTEVFCLNAPDWK